MFAEPARLAFAAFGERDISEASVLPRYRPGGFAVADHVDLRQGGSHFANPFNM